MVSTVQNFVDLIGLEKEFWLIDNKEKFHEPALYGLPHDEFGFLVELRTKPCINVKDLTVAYDNEYVKLDWLARNFNLTLTDKPVMPRTEMIDTYYAIKYEHHKLPDLTANIYVGTKCSHATGIFEGYLTAGLHVHFSRHDEFHRRIQLPIETITRKMDWNFRSIIQNSNRIMGEYEIKPYGFEYRSLPANAPINEVMNTAFRILKSV